jgi:hypothetical protein
VILFFRNGKDGFFLFSRFGISDLQKFEKLLEIFQKEKRAKFYNQVRFANNMEFFSSIYPQWPNTG